MICGPHTKTKPFFNFNHPHKTKSIDPCTKTKSFLARTQKPSQIDPYAASQVNFDPCIKTKSFSARTQKHVNFQLTAGTRNKSKFDPYTKTKSILIPRTETKLISSLTLNSSQFRSPLWKQVNFDASLHKQKVNFDADSKPSHFLSPNRSPHKTKSIAIPTLKSSKFRSPTPKSSIFRPPTQQSQFWFQH